MNNLERWRCLDCGETITEPDTPTAHNIRKGHAPKPEVLPCPFCGRSDLLGIEPRPETGYLGVRCRACGCIGPGGRSSSHAPHEQAYAEAIAHWNRRDTSNGGVP